MTNKKEFKNWLSNNVESNATVSYYLKGLDDLSELLKEEKSIDDNIYEINNKNKLNEILNRLKKNGNLYNFNRERNNGGPHAALVKYIEFLENHDIKEKSIIEVIRREFEENKNLKNIKEYEHNINFYIYIKDNVNKVVQYWDKLSLDNKNLLEENNPTKFLYWEAYKSEMINLEELKEINSKEVEKYIPDQKEALKDKVSQEQLDNWEKKYSDVNKINYYLDANKEYYSILLKDKDIANIIDLIVNIFSQTNASKSAFGAPKKIINFNKLGKIFLFFKDLSTGQDLNKYIENNNDLNIRLLGSGIAFELEGLYNLEHFNYFITNSRIYSFLRYFTNKLSNYTLSGDEVQKYYKEYKETFMKEINDLKNYIDLKTYDLNLIEKEEDSFKENLIADRLIYEFTKKYLDSKNEENNINNDSSNEKNINEKAEDINIVTNILQKKKQIILYGPPGTGKTYNTKRVIFNWKKEDLLEDVNRNEIEKYYEKLDKEGRIKFITFHQSYAYEEFIEGIKPNLDGGINISYQIEDGTFKKFSNLAKKNYDKSKVIQEEIDFNKLIEISFKSLENEENVIIPTKRTEISIYDFNDKTIFFEKKNKDRSHSLSINTLNKIFYDEGQDVSKYIKGGLEPYYKAVLKYINNKLKNIKKESFVYEKEELKPYFLIIDEINRGNISKIFGELITLLESDKRLGQDDELIVELPYSKEKFGIPPNLYIIATMNTSDKSIANLDIALRRRFGFEEILPSSNLVSEEACISECNKEYYKQEQEIKLNILLEKLNQRIEYLLDKDHTLGHSYFIKVNSLDSLRKTFYREIIPLLEEYFYGDYEKLNLILGDLFFEIKENNLELVKEIFGREIDDFSNDEKKFTLKYLDKDSFKEAIKEILNLN